MIEGSSLSPVLAPLQRLLRERHLTICAAESCTGGLVCAALTDLPGSSEYFQGGIVTYANEAKMAQLGVKAATLREFGAVSRDVAGEMVRGVQAMFGTDVALSITGVAGPGAEASKPAGLTYIGCLAEGRLEVRQFNWIGGRASNRVASVEAALALAIEMLSGQHAKSV